MHFDHCAKIIPNRHYSLQKSFIGRFLSPFKMQLNSMICKKYLKNVKNIVKKWSGKNPLYCVRNTKRPQTVIKTTLKRHPILARNGVFCAKTKREKKEINLPNHTVMEGLVSPKN